MIGPATPNKLPSIRTPPSLERLTTRSYLVVFVVALLLRAGFGAFQLVRADHPAALTFPDEEQYWLMAGSLHAGQGLRDELGFRATRMPLYPAVLSLFAGWSEGVIVAKIFHWMAGAVVAALIAGAATALFGGRVGLIGGLWVAADPFLVFASSLLLTETLFMAALVGLWWVAAPTARRYEQGVSLRRWAATGLLAVLLVYLRESAIGLVILLLAFDVVCRRFDTKALIGAALTVGLVIVSLVPWAARNARVTGHWCWLTHRGGISLYDGVGPQADGSSDLGDIKQMPPVRDLTEAQWNRYFLDESINSIRENPARILRLAGVKLQRLWNPFPNVETHQSFWVRTVSAAWTLPTFAFAVAGVILLAKSRGGNGLRAAMFLLIPAGYVSAMHSLFVGSVRYRLVAMPMLEILATVALVVLFERLRKHRPIDGITLGQ